MSKQDPYIYKRIVDDKLSMVKILNKLGTNYSVNQPCYCPFHDNTNTPAAMIYDNNGKQSLYCFSERKTYYPSDAISILLNQDPYAIGEELFNRLTPQEQQELIDKYDKTTSIKYTSKLDFTPDFRKKLAMFKYNKIDFNDIVKAITKL